MRRLISWRLVLILAALIHLDWHFARPLHHGLSLDWATHWVFAIAFFAAAGWYVARKWPGAPWHAAAWNVGLALFVAQIVEPVLEEIFYEGRFAYVVSAERWTAFWECVGAGIPAMAVAIWLASKRDADTA